MNYLDKKVSNKKDLDPIDWAIVAIIIGGASLIVSIKSKIDTNRVVKEAAVQKKAITGNRVRLNKIKHKLSHINIWLSELTEIGNIVVNDDETGISRSSIEFESEGELEAFNEMFDYLTSSISRINRLISELDPDGMPFTDNDKAEFVNRPIERLKEDTEGLLNTDMDSKERIGKLKELLYGYELLISNIDEAIGRFE